jgi:sodium-dependent dicarboxylate transporter 2/3/5
MPEELDEKTQANGPLRRFFNRWWGKRDSQVDGKSGSPLRVLKPRVLGGAWGFARFFGRFGLVILLTVAVLLLPAPPGISPEGHRALAAFVFTASILALEPVSLPIAALIVPVALVALGVADTPLAFEPFSRPVVFLILGSLFLAEALRKHGLTRRLALFTIVASGGGMEALLLGLIGIAAFLSMWIENTATAAMLIPVALTVAMQIRDKEAARRLLMLMILGIAYGASIGGMATIMGSASNAVASSFLAQIRVWTFIDWMSYGLPSLLLMYPLTWWVLVRLGKIPVQRLDMAPIREQLTEMGPISRMELEILLVLGAAAILWVTGPLLEQLFNLPPTLLASAMVAVIAVAYMAVRNIINWDDLKGVSWGIFFIIGAGLSLGEALIRTGVTDWLALLIGPIITSVPLLVSMLMLVLISALLTNLLNNATIAAVFVPVVISLAKADPELNAVQLVLPVTLATTFGYSLPSASGRMALISATGLVNRGDMMRYGFAMTVVSSVALALLFYLLAVFGLI